MTVYTTLPTDDLNLAVTVIDDPDLVQINITPASVNLTGAVNSVNGFTGVVSLTTTEIPEGSNEYFTNARADARVDLQTGANLDLSFADTDDLAEGPTNLYYTDARVDAHLTGGTGVTYNAGNISIGQDVSTTADVEFNTMTADMFGVQHFTAKAREAITAGQPVYISGHSGNTPEVMVADFDDPAKMPAFGIASADIGNNNNGSISTFGDLKNVDTTGTTEGETWVVGDELFVNNNKLTNTRPTGSTEEVQKIAKIIRVHANNGQLFLMGAGRTNDIPNLTTGNVFIGNGSGYEKRQLTYTDILNTPSLAAYITASSTDTLTNKSGSNSQWTNDEAYLKANALTPYYTSTQVDALPVSTFSNDASYITASTTDTLTNKSGNISMFTNDAGYLTSETDSQTLSFTSPDLTISNGNTVDLSGLIDGGTY
jgi:hypothetical protein